MLNATTRRIWADYSLLLLLSVVLQLIYLYLLPISIEGDAIGYYLAARYFAGEPNGLFSFFHPPGYPLFLLLTGVLWLKSFHLTIAAQAIMGILSPALVYGILRGVNRTTALVTASIYALSGVPYSYAKLLITEQVYVFLILTGMFGVSRFIDSKRPEYAILAIACCPIAILVRNESLYLSLLAVIVIFISAWPVRRLLAIVSISSVVALGILMSWSICRASLLGDYTLIGSLNNYTGHTLFYRVYVSLGESARFWQCSVVVFLDRRCADATFTKWPLVEPENGPASQRLAEIVGEWASTSGPTRFPGRTARQIVSDYFANPTQSTDSFDGYGLASELVNERLGLIKGDALLRDVALEAVRAHPQIIYMIGAERPSILRHQF